MFSIACSDNKKNIGTVFAEAASSPDAVNTVNINKMFKGMSPGMQRKMSFMALTTTSKIDSEEQKAAIRKQFQRTFQKSASWMNERLSYPN